MIKSAKAILRETVIPALRRRALYFDVLTIRGSLADEGVRVKRETLNRYCYECARKSLMYSAGRGWYSTLEHTFNLSPGPVAKIIGRLGKQFPFLDFSCWSTRQINAYLHHLLGSFVTFVHVDRDLMPSVFDFLRSAGHDAYLNPTRRESRKSFVVGENTVIIRPALRDTRLEGHVAGIENILVDLRVELDSLPLMDIGEYRMMVQRVVTSRRIEISKLIRYAKRRKADWRDLFCDTESIIATVAPKCG